MKHQDIITTQTASSLCFGIQTREHDDGLSVFAHVCRVSSASPTVCSEVRRRRMILCKRFGCGGRIRIGRPWLRVRAHSWRRQQPDCASTSPSLPTRAAKRMSGLGFPNQWTPSGNPGLDAERREALRLAVLVLLETTLALTACRIYSARSVRLLLPPDRGHPASGGSKHPPTRLPCP